MFNDVIVLDLETTGTDPVTSEIIEIGIVKLRNGEKEEWSSLVKPQNSIPSFIANLTGITNDMVKEAPTIQELLPIIRNNIESSIIVAQNRYFDLGFLEKYLGPLPNYSIDTIELAKIVEPSFDSYSLANLALELDINNGSPHRALADAQTTFAVLSKLWSKLSAFDLGVLMELKSWLRDESQGLYILLNQLIKNITKTGNWTKIDAGNPQSFFNQSPQMPLRIEKEKIDQLFMKNGLLAQKFPNYEVRTQQTEMFRTIGKAFEQGRNLLVEAGTGVGKTLAYLSAGLQIASEQNKVVISTHTIALQEQLCKKDIPLLEQVLDEKIAYVLLKGRNNYLCWRLWHNIKEEQYNWSWEQRVFWARITVWLKKTLSGDKEDLKLINNKENEFWYRVGSTSDFCLGVKCPSFNSCWYNNIRNKANKAHLLIVNHSLLLSDAKMGTGLLPAHDYIIIDEAHQLEEVATDQFTYDASKKGIIKLLDNLKFSLNSQIFQQWQKKAGFSDLAQDLGEIRKNIFASIEGVVNNSESIFLPWENSYETVRIKESNRTTVEWSKWMVSAENFRDSIQALSKAVLKLIEAWELSDSFESWMPEIRGWTANNKQVLSYLESLKTFLYESDQVFVFWVERIQKNNDVSFKSAPIDIANCLKETLFDLKESVILTSATMSVNGKVTLFQESLGINPEKTDWSIISSPFEFEKQAIIYIPEKIPDPTTISDGEYVLQILPLLQACLKSFLGNSLVLFTSHKMLQEVYFNLKPLAEEIGVELLAHGIDGSRNSLINQLKIKQKTTMLFGANTFWEGVDLPGDALKHLVIVKLPFWPPNLPVVQARVEHLELKGKNGFYHYSLPKAVIRFKQGFGRLIRTAHDKGTVIILDRRIVTKRYGKIFINALPNMERLIVNTQTINEKISNWF